MSHDDATADVQDDSRSDYERVGGGPAVAQVVDSFYRRVLADPALAPFFAGIDMARLRRHQVLLISQVLGGPAEYDGRELRAAHEPLGISDGDFDRVVAHLVTALRDAGVPDDIIGRVGATLGATRGDVVSAG